MDSSYYILVIEVMIDDSLFYGTIQVLTENLIRGTIVLV